MILLAQLDSFGIPPKWFLLLRITNFSFSILKQLWPIPSGHVLLTLCEWACFCYFYSVSLCVSHEQHYANEHRQTTSNRQGTNRCILFPPLIHWKMEMFAVPVYVDKLYSIAYKTTWQQNIHFFATKSSFFSLYLWKYDKVGINAK